MMKIRYSLLVALVGLVMVSTASAQQHWVTTWAAAPQEPFFFPAPPPAGQPAPSPAPPPTPAMQLAKGFHNQTVRMTVHTSIGGARVRIAISNAMGKTPLVIGAAHIARRGEGSGVAAGSDHALLFSGKPACTIPPGALMVSDAIDFDVPPQGDLSVSLYLPGDTGPPTAHAVGLHTTYVSGPGNFAGERSFADAVTTQSWYWLSAVHVFAPGDAGAIVTFGDSITDGTTSTPDTDRSWPSVLAARLSRASGKSQGGAARIAVVNQGIAGNRLLHDLVGPNALARLDRDVFSQPGVKWMTLLEGINDIGFPYRAGTPAGEEVTPEQITAALQQIVERAHMRGVKVLGGTLTPFEGAAYYMEKGEEMRQAVNRWIRGSGTFDAVVDFDAITRDPNNPKRLRPEFNDRDHLHPNDAGYKAMAEAIDLSFFR
jgi:lysophospholipase L1-like esterase